MIDLDKVLLELELVHQPKFTNSGNFMLQYSNANVFKSSVALPIFNNLIKIEGSLHHVRPISIGSDYELYSNVISGRIQTFFKKIPNVSVSYKPYSGISNYTSSTDQNQFIQTTNQSAITEVSISDSRIIKNVFVNTIAQFYSMTNTTSINLTDSLSSFNFQTEFGTLMFLCSNENFQSSLISNLSQQNDNQILEISGSYLFKTAKINFGPVFKLRQNSKDATLYQLESHIQATFWNKINYSLNFGIGSFEKSSKFEPIFRTSLTLSI